MIYMNSGNVITLSKEIDQNNKKKLFQTIISSIFDSSSSFSSIVESQS
jgi:hypothetical protein